MTGTGVVQDVTGIALSTALTTQSMPAVTSGGTGYLVAWTDYRNNATASADIYGTRVSDAGLVQDPSGSALSTAPNRQITPSVASNGDDYLVAWSDYRNKATTKYDIYGTRVTAAGAVQDVNGLALSTASGDQGTPSVASNGIDYLVAWIDNRDNANTGYDIYATRVAASGLIQDPAGIALSTAPSLQAEPVRRQAPPQAQATRSRYLYHARCSRSRSKIQSRSTTLHPRR